MKRVSPHLSALILAMAVTTASPSVSAQSLALTYKLHGNDDARPASTNCARWIGPAASCGSAEPLRHFSRQSDVKTVPAASVAAPMRPAEPSLIPYRGEAAARSNDARTPTGDPSQADFNFHFGSRARAGRNEDDLERRLRNAAYESRANRSSLNAVGLELVVPIQTRLLKSPDPAPPE